MFAMPYHAFAFKSSINISLVQLTINIFSFTFTFISIFDFLIFFFRFLRVSCFVFDIVRETKTGAGRIAHTENVISQRHTKTGRTLRPNLTDGEVRLG